MLLSERLDYMTFSPSEQVIVDYLKSQQLSLESKTTGQIAKETYSSKSTIVKVAQRMGYAGWRDFKKAYLAELHYLANQTASVDANYPFGPTDHYLTIAKRLATIEQEAIRETADLLDYETLQAAVGRLSQAKAIHVFALSNNLLLSQEFRYNMERIKQPVYVHAIYGEGMYAATLMEPDECALVISYSGETTSLLSIVDMLKSRQIPIVLITSIGDNSMVQLADVALRITTRERLYSKIATFVNDAAITYVLDVLYACLFSQDYEKNLALREGTSRIFEITRRGLGQGLKE